MNISQRAMVFAALTLVIIVSSPICVSADGSRDKVMLAALNRQANRVAAQNLPSSQGWVADVSTGSAHTCALTTSGGVKCWGRNAGGGLGDGTYWNRATPVDVVGLQGNIEAVSAGSAHTCAVTTEGRVVCWGFNGRGALGDGSTIDRLTPVSVSGLDSEVRAISAGEWHTCAITGGGGVVCWGGNSRGQLGDGTRTTRLTPVAVVGLETGARMIGAGGDHTCAVTATNAVKCWGANDWGTLGDGTTIDRLTPTDVVDLAQDALAVSAGATHTCALSQSGAVKCWGGNGNGQLGDGTTATRLTPVNVTGFPGTVKQVDVGYLSSCAILEGGAAMCWGANWYGELGDGTTNDRLTPVNVIGLNAGVQHIETGGHTCASAENGTAQCWGWNQYGQLGTGATTNRATPTDVVLEVPYDCSAVTEIAPPECNALVALYRATNGPFWQARGGWLDTATPCGWQGVTCEAGHVQELALPLNNLVNRLPPELGDLAWLRGLDLSMNAIGGSLPATTGNLVALEQLDLSRIEFSGQLPPAVGNLTALRRLDLHGNTLTDELPSDLGSWRAIEYLDLGFNNFRGQLPESLGQLSALVHIDLSHNRFSGALPWEDGQAPNYPHLTYADFSYNQIGSLLPEGMERWQRLMHLDLSHNQFKWELPWGIGDLLTLEYLDMSDNYFTGVIPPRYGNLTAIQSLDLSSNMLEGGLPLEWGELRQLSYLDLHQNLLSGPLPAEWGQIGSSSPISETMTFDDLWRAGVYLDLSGNHLFGEIPSALGENAAMIGLQLSGNQLRGTVPAALANRAFAAIDLNYNQLTTDDARWQSTQTIPPAHLQAIKSGNIVTLTWTLIPYLEHGGFYEISYATNPSGPYAIHGHTINKWYGEYTVVGLVPDAAYYFRVRTVTPAHAYRSGDWIFNHPYVQPNNLWSDYTPVVCVNCGASDGSRVFLSMIAR